MKKILGSLIAIALFAAPASAATIPLEVLGAWSNASGGSGYAYTPGEGTFDANATVAWGTPVTNAGKSSYTFASSYPTEFGAAPVGTQFKVGDFLHNNRPIAIGTGISSVELELQFDFSADSSPRPIDTLAMVFHTETRNRASNCPGEVTPCPDVVTIDDAINVSMMFTYLGQQYLLEVLGFSTDGVNFSNEFITQENALNSRGLYALITPVAVPEPTTMLLLGAGLVAGAARLRRRS